MLLLDFPFIHFLGITFITDSRAKMFLLKKEKREPKCQLTFPSRKHFTVGVLTDIFWL